MKNKEGNGHHQRRRIFSAIRHKYNVRCPTSPSISALVMAEQKKSVSDHNSRSLQVKPED
jgi:hypothetical protein